MITLIYKRSNLRKNRIVETGKEPFHNVSFFVIIIIFILFYY